nr:SAM-dependent methyltransferase [Aliikangiella sp. G2MR2-5]
MESGRLTVVGCGLHPGHMTSESESYISKADKVLVVAPNPLSIQHIRGLNPCAENLGLLYEGDVNRLQTYHMMAEKMVELVLEGYDVCCVFYGHPGIFALSPHLAIEKLKTLGKPAKMLPGISADACLFADLNQDPATVGCQSFEATQFLLTERPVDPSSALILWQVGLTAEHTLKERKPGKHGISALIRLLRNYYSEQHKVCVYEAPMLPGFEHREDWVTLNELETIELNTISTLYIPAEQPMKFAKERLEWLKLEESDLSAWKLAKS